MEKLDYDRAEALRRSLPLFGEEGLAKLNASRLALVGLGGVGGHAAEALARAGVGTIYLIDGDQFALSNLNRQRFASLDSLGKSKAETVAAELRKINPEGRFVAIPRYVTPENLGDFPFGEVDYVLDAIDQVAAKIALICHCRERNVPILSAMGTGFKLDPALLRVTDLAKTEMDSLAKKVRVALRKRGIAHLKVVFSPEPPQEGREAEKGVVLSSPFVPAVAGILMAKEATMDLLAREK